MDMKASKTFFSNYINGQSQWGQPTATEKLLIPPDGAVERADGKATVEIKQEKRLKDYKKAATASAAKAGRACTNDAMRKAEKEAALTAKRAAALVEDPVTLPAEAARRAADAASAASVTIHSDDDEDDDDVDEVFAAGEGTAEAVAAAQPQLFRAGAAHQESQVLHPLTRTWVTCTAAPARTDVHEPTAQTMMMPTAQTMMERPRRRSL